MHDIGGGGLSNKDDKRVWFDKTSSMLKVLDIKIENEEVGEVLKSKTY
jgi:hypothetical protein